MPEDLVTTNKATFTRFSEAVDSGDVEIISNTIDEVFDPDMVNHTPLPMMVAGPQAITGVFVRLLQAFPDLLHIPIRQRTNR